MREFYQIDKCEEQRQYEVEEQPPGKQMQVEWCNRQPKLVLTHFWGGYFFIVFRV